MAYTTINKSTDYFNTVNWTGNGSTNAITGVGFQPDWVWGKSHTDGYSHQIYDATRGATYSIKTNGNAAQETLSTGLTSFDSDGFTLGSNTNINASGHSVTAWNWKANGAGSTNSDGTISATVSVNTTSGFSIMKWTGNATAGATVGHGLGAAPDFIINKNTSSTTEWRFCWPFIRGNDTANSNGTGAESATSLLNNTNPSSSVITFGSDATFNGNGNTIITYAFKQKTGYSKFGRYTGNGNTDGAFIYCGFKPAFLLIKTNSTTGGWQIYDDTNNPTNPTSKFLIPSSSGAITSGSNDIDFLSNGFKTRTTVNPGTTDSFVYAVFAAAPIVGTNNIPATAR